MENKSITLRLISLSAIALLTAYVAGLLDWVLDYSAGVGNDTVGLLGNAGSIIALLVYTYFGIRFFNRFIDSVV